MLEHPPSANHHKIVEFLLTNGANPDEEYQGRSAVKIAINQNNPEVVRVLVAAGAQLAPTQQTAALKHRMIQAIEDGYQEGGRKLAEKIWQFGAIILPFKETGVVNFDFPTVSTPLTERTFSTKECAILANPESKLYKSCFITMVETSVNAISNQTPKDNLIAIFATPSTIKSGLYQEALKKNFSVISMSPKNWVKNIETSKSDDQIKEDFDLEMLAFTRQYGDEKIKQIKSVGLFCTHYPYFKEEIQKYLSAQGNNDVKIFSQGELFADDILKDVAKRLSKLYKKRSQTLPKKCQSGNSFHIDSHISGNDKTALINAINKMHGKELEINVVDSEPFENKAL